MAFTSFSFLGFVAALIVLYYIIPKKFQWILLLLASYSFYLLGGGYTVLYMVFTTASTYFAGRILGRLNDRRRAAPKEDKPQLSAIKRNKRLVVLCALLINFGLLYIVKYSAFTVDIVNALSGRAFSPPQLLMPVGISFYIFQSAGYVIDVYRGKYAPEENIAKFALFVSFFPQIIQGPISRFHQLAPQLTAEHPLDLDKIKYGLQLIMWGFLKKLIIAERAAVAVDTVFGDYLAYPGSVLSFAVLFYCIQLYCDFSGGIDITRGVAQMLGIDMAENFRRPIFAVSLADFWRRWHITLGAWMRDYLFYPIALSKGFGRLGKFVRKHLKGTAGKIFTTSLATFIVYFVIGVWHGANLKYIAFGFWNGAIITASILLESRFIRAKQALHIEDSSKLWRLFAIVRTSLLVFIGRYITRAPYLKAAIVMLWRTAADFQPGLLLDGTLLSLGLSGFDFGVVLLGVAILLLVELYQERGGHVRLALEKQGAFIQVMAIVFPVAIILFLGLLNTDFVSSAFIYAQF